jgi:hypothetical protein
MPQQPLGFEHAGLIVSDTRHVEVVASLSITASAWSGKIRYSRIEPTTFGSQRPSGCLSTSV